MTQNFISRLGLFAKKVGMSRIILDKKVYAITLLEVPKAHVIEKKTHENYSVLKLGTDAPRGKIKQPQKKELERKNLPLCVKMQEFKVSHEECEKFTEALDLNIFELNEYIDVKSKNIGKGFAGVMKLWNFKGSKASHGASLSHRSLGSTGTRDANYKNKKMPGRMGGKFVSVQNQKILYKDDELNLIGILGSVPGKAGTWVTVTKAIKAKVIKG